jgi:hypothetical protein
MGTLASANGSGEIIFDLGLRAPRVLADLGHGKTGVRDSPVRDRVADIDEPL